MTSSEIRRQFIEFFRQRGHTVVPSSPVVPFDDPTLLFTNAGMNQFKPIFLGQKPADVDRWTGVTPGMATRAANSQKCIRAGGKHNDLDDVGKDTYHHTFFEMLGNWSFGDYFKQEAIAWAWELLTKVWGIPKERLHATYFQGDAAEGLDPDQEAADLWRTTTDINPSHIHPGNKKDNFWEMGDTGPCGPCSEIHIDLTPDCSGGALVNAGDARVMEIWNLVFIQFNRGSDSKLTPLPAKHVDTGMGFERLCSVLQGLAAGKLGNFTNYDTDVFTPIFDAIRKRTGAPAYTGTLPDQGRDRQGANLTYQDRGFVREKTHPPLTEGLQPSPPQPAPQGSLPDGRGPERGAQAQIMIDVSYRVIADHLRALTFAITDGAMPSNEGRGFVLRRILRRAVRFGRQYLNMHEPFMCDLVKPLVAHMGDAFPELHNAHGGKNVKHVTEIIRDEEASFLKTLDRGMKLFDEAVERALQNRAFQRRDREGASLTNQDRGLVREKTTLPEGENLPPASPQPAPQGSLPDGRGSDGVISGEDAFKLHDTYGFPIDLTQQMAEERGLTVDIAEYERLMEEARKLARGKPVSPTHAKLLEYLRETKTEFIGYDSAQLDADIHIETVLDGQHNEVETLGRGQPGYLLLDKTPFYPEQGGQVGDQGRISAPDANWEFEVENTIKSGNLILHFGRPQTGTLNIELPSASKTGGGAHHNARAHVNRELRTPITQNHTATHLLNWALREALCPPEERVNPHVQQKGSLVDAEKTRFDFSHNKALSEEEIEHIEGFVRMQIAADHEVYAATREEDFVDQAAARKVNTLRAVFGEKYPEKVRVVSIGVPVTEADAKAAGRTDWLLKSPQNPEWMRYSVEFCGGTHVRRTGEVEDFVIVSEEAVAKGVRRVVGVTAQAARDARARAAALRDRIAALWDAPEEEFHARLVEVQKEFTDAIIPVLERHKIREQLDQLAEKAKKIEKQKAAASGGAVMERVAELLAMAHQSRDRQGANLTNQDRGLVREEAPPSEGDNLPPARPQPASPGSLPDGRGSDESAFVRSGVTVIVAEVPAAPADALRGAIDWIRQKTEASAVLLACVGDDGKVTLLAGMSKTVADRGLKAGDLIKEVSPLVGGKGGGRPDLAQGGGTDAAGLPKALEAAAAWIRKRIAQASGT